MEITVWKYTMKSTVNGIHESTQWKVQFMVNEWNTKKTVQVSWCLNIDWLTWWYFTRFTRYCTLNVSYREKQYLFLRLTVLQTLRSITKLACIQNCFRRVTREFFIDDFDLVLLKKVTYFLSSCSLHTSMLCVKIFMT